MNPALTNSRRGSIGLAMIIVLVILQLLVVGVVISGARDLDLADHRLDTARSVYAAEAGANMATREMMTGLDEDGDGGIGTISDDGIGGNNPALGSASFYVSSAGGGGQTVLTSRGSAGAARRQVDQAFQTVNVMSAFSRLATNPARYSAWNGTAWGANTAGPDIGGDATFLVLRPCPTRQEIMLAAQDGNQDVNVAFHTTSGGWGAATEVCTDSGETLNRAFDAVYEAQSGDGLIAYWKNSATQIGYRTFNGVTLSSEGLVALAGATDCTYLAAYPRPQSDDVILLALNISSGTPRLSAALWNGASWGAWSHLETTLSTSTEECFAVAYETLSGTALCVYIEVGAATPRYRTWNGASWSSESSMPTVGGVGRWVRLAADPTSDKMLCAVQDENLDINVNSWSGSAWGTNLEVQNDISSLDRRQFDLAYEPSSAEALIVYQEDKKNFVRYRTWNGTSWSAQTTGTNFNRKLETIQTVTGGAAGQIFIAVVDDNQRLRLTQWDGAAMSDDVIIESAMGGGMDTEPYMICIGTGQPRILSWEEVQPQ